MHYFQNGIDNFEIEHKTCKFLVRGAVPPQNKNAGGRRSLPNA